MALPPNLASANLSQIPAMKPPPGKVPNFADPTIDGSTRSSTITMGIVLGTITVLCCALRIYTRVRIMKSPGWDDAWLIVAIVCACAYTGLVLSCASLVSNVHQWNVSLATLIHYTPLLRATAYIYFTPALLSAKIALASFFLRIFGAKPMIRITIWCAIVYSAFVSFFAFFYSLAMCPDTGLRLTKCTTEFLKPFIIASALNVASDTSLLVIPLWGVFSLQMQNKRKIPLSLVFLTGILAVLSSCLGLYYRIAPGDNNDMTWNFMAIGIPSMMEIDITIIVACLPTLPCLLKEKFNFFERAGKGARSIKKAFSAANESVAESIGSSFGLRKSNRIMSTASTESLEPNMPTDSDIRQMEESRRGSDELTHVTSFIYQRGDT